MVIHRALQGAALVLGVWLSSIHISNAQIEALSPQHVDAVANHLSRSK